MDKNPSRYTTVIVYPFLAKRKTRRLAYLDGYNAKVIEVKPSIIFTIELANPRTRED